jgi:hypothetical protein
MSLIEFEFSSSIKALFLLFLALSANFLGNTLNCSIQKILIDNVAIRHIFVLMIVYFTIDFTSKSSMSPLEILKNSFIIYVLFILLTKQSYEMFIINILLLFTIFIIFVEINYENTNNIDSSNFVTLNNYLQYILIITLVTGFVLYYNKEYDEHKDNFDNITFLLGTNKCSHIN